MYYCARKHGSIGNAAYLVQADDYDHFSSMCPEMELLAVFETEHEARNHMVGQTLYTFTPDYQQGRFARRVPLTFMDWFYGGA